jgi:outer membrane protein OmpA-like peptidoglycan-associated protein
MKLVGMKIANYVAMTLAMSFCLLSPASAADEPGCQNPSWSAARLPGFEISGCASKVWMSMDIALVGGDKTLEGSRQTVDYTLTDPSKDPANETARRFFAEQGKKAGATLVSEPDGGWQAVLRHQTPAGDFYYMYTHGGGNDQSTTAFTLTTIKIGPPPQEVRVQNTPQNLAGSVDPCKNPPWLAAQYSYFKLASCEFKDWAAIELDLAAGHKTVAGHMLRTVYELTDEKRDPVALLPAKNYATALLGLGAHLVSEPDKNREPVLTRTTPEGEFWYIYRQSSGNDDSVGSYSLITIQVAPMVQEVEARDSPRPLESSLNPCANPPWLVKQFAYFKLDHCGVREFDRIELDLPSGLKTAEGLMLTTEYTLTDPKKEPVALVPWENYVNALKRIGASLVSDPERHGEAVLTRTTPQGEFWYVYRQSQGNDDGVGSYTLTTMRIGPMPQDVVVRDTTEPVDARGTACQPPPWLVRQFPYFRLDHCDSRDFDTITLQLPDGPKILSGHVIENSYVQSDNSKDPVTFALRQNYVNALEPLGAKLISDPAEISQAVLTRATPQGEFWYIYKQSGGNEKSADSYTLTTVQIGGPTPKSCVLEIYGVNFDFDKAILRPESEPVLTQVLGLFTGDPSYAAEVGGHTDNVGQHNYNLQLSGKRAAAVKDWLVAHGVAGSRMTSAGYGDTKPLVPNTTDENRFRNRRVELRRSGCKS